MNGAAQGGLHLWRVQRPARDVLVARAAAGDFRRVARLARRCRVQVAILQRIGLPFVAVRAVRRHALLLGGALFFGLIQALGSFVWFMRVEGTQAVDPSRVLAVAARAGLRPGVLRSRVETATVERRLHLELPDLAWVSVELRGTLGLVRVAERVRTSDDLTRPGHVLAARAGVVERVAVLRGEPLVVPGETVAPGQVLISGLLPPGSPEHRARLEEEELPYVRAAGSVRARVWHEGYGEVPLVRITEEPTGRTRRTLFLLAGSRRLALGPRQPPFEARAEVGGKRLALAGRPLSLGWQWVVWHEVVRRRHTLTLEEARREALELARREAQERLGRAADPVAVTETVWTSEEGGGIVRARVVVESREEIGRFEPIGGRQAGGLEEGSGPV